MSLLGAPAGKGLDLHEARQLQPHSAVRLFPPKPVRARSVDPPEFSPPLLQRSAPTLDPTTRFPERARGHTRQ